MLTVPDVVRHVADLGVAVFVAPPSRDESEFRRPAGWQRFTAEGNDERLAAWRPGSAVIAVCGGLFVVVDVDPRNGGDVAKVAALLADLGVRVFARVATPGGGMHFYVAGHRDLPSCNKLPGYPGVDVQSHGHNVFLPGTQRPKYGGAGYSVEHEDLAALGDGGDPDGAEALGDWLGEQRGSGAEPFAVSPPWDGAAPDARQTRYLEAVLRNQVQEVALSPRGHRNARLYTAALKLGSFVSGAGLDEWQVRERLSEAADRCELTADDGPRQVAATIAQGLRNGKRNPRAVPAEQAAAVLDDAAFWSARADLALIHAAARAALCAPWAVLGAVLARLVTAVPKFVVLPNMVGSQASLNLFIALVGPSGGGKGAAAAVAADLLDVGHITTGSVGSGEGLAHMFARRVKGDVERIADAVLFDVAEVDTLTALGARQGATLQPELRKGWMGEKLGFSYADPSKHLPIARHDYRLCMVVGVQPGRAAGLLDDVDGGTPQRFVWLPTTDPDVPDLDVAPPGQHLTWRPADLGVDWADAHGRRAMTFPGTVTAQVRAGQRDRLRGVGTALDGHALLARLKVAAALALLDKRMDVDARDWELSGVVMAVSDATRGRVVDALGEQKRQANEARGKAEGTRTAIACDTVDERRQQRVARLVLRHLQRADGQWVSRRSVAVAIHGRDRELLPEALERLLSAGQIEVDASTPGRPSYRANEPSA